VRYLLAFVCACVAFGFAAERGYTISGVVVGGDANKPLRHMLVTIMPSGKPGQSLACVTGDDGQFKFTELPAGKFSLSAQGPNSLPESFRENASYSTAIVTGPGLDSTNIRFALSPRGSISGTVRDEENEPIQGAQVLLFHRGVFSGRRETNLETGKATNSSGAFQFGGLRAGTYFVAVQGQPWYAEPGGRQAPPGSEFDVSYPLTYYGGATDPASAAPITIGEGGSQTIEIALRPERSAHIVIGKIDPNSDGQGFSFSVWAKGPGGVDIPVSFRFMAPTKTEQTVAIAPGRYALESPGKGRQTVDVRGDLDTANLGSLPKTEISGKLSFEGTPAAGVRLLFVTAAKSLEAPLAKDGTFSVDGAAAGRYQAELFNAAGYYIKDISAGERAARNGQIDVSDGAAVHVSILVAKGASNLDGVAVKDGLPFAGAMVLLVPEDLGRTILIRRDQSDSDGTFRLPEIAPGQYTLVAIGDGRDLEYAEASVIAPYLKDGQPIRIPIAGTAPIKVNVLDRRR
jgi:hypothetical protein